MILECRSAKKLSREWIIRFSRLRILRDKLFALFSTSLNIHYWTLLFSRSTFALLLRFSTLLLKALVFFLMVHAATRRLLGF